MSRRILFDGRWIRPGSPDGITRYSRELIRALIEKGVSVDLIICDKKQAGGLGITETYMAPAQTSLIASRKALARILNQKKHDLYFCPHFLQILPKTSTPTVLTCHDLTPWQHRSKTASRVWRIFHSSLYGLRKLLRRADWVATVSETAKKDLLSILPSLRIKVIYNGVSVDFFDASNVSVKKQLLYVGRYEPYKNVETAIRVLKELPDYRLICVGIISKSRQLELQCDRVEFVGPVSDTEYIKLLTESSALIMPSEAEGFGLPIIEAMAAGTPVVCSDIEVFHEIGGNSLNYAGTHDASAYAAAVLELEDNDLRKRSVSSARKKSQAFTWEKSAEALLELCTIDK